MLVPTPRGPLTHALADVLHARPGAAVPDARPPGAEIGTDDDVQLALWMLYELHYRGFDDAGGDLEWDPDLIRLRGVLEDRLLADLRRTVPVPASTAPVAERLRELVESDDGPALSRRLQRDADRSQFAEWAVHRSVYQLKEADPHTWGIPRLSGRPKAALVQIQVDEYGDGDAARVHAELFRATLRGLGLDDAYGAYVDAVPAITLQLSNVMSLFGLRRSLRGALVGHLAAYEMTSSAPCRRYATGLRRLGAEQATLDFFDVHVTADALHEQLAMHDLCGALAADQAALTEDIVFGAGACLHVENRFAEQVLAAWDAGRSSLRQPAPALLGAGR